jgi:hypothetical protein
VEPLRAFKLIRYNPAKKRKVWGALFVEKSETRIAVDDTPSTCERLCLATAAGFPDYRPTEVARGCSCTEARYSGADAEKAIQFCLPEKAGGVARPQAEGPSTLEHV